MAIEQRKFFPGVRLDRPRKLRPDFVRQRVSNTCLEVGPRLEARDPAEMTIAGKFYDVRGMMAAI